MIASPLSMRLRLYKMMYLIRQTELVLMDEYHPHDEMRCPMHFCVGQEAMPAALAQVLRPRDVLMSHYRSHGYYLAKGAPLDAMVAEFYGKATGANSGVAGSMELGSHEHNFFSGAIVGGSLFIPLGSAFAQKYRDVDEISVSVIGDGVFDEGISYEIFNLAALQRLPLLVICENNGYAAHTSVGARQVNPILSDHIRSFGIAVTKLDGNDSELLLENLDKIVREIRAGRGPHFLEIETYRQCGHVGPGDDSEIGYRSAEEVTRWMARDPVSAMRGLLGGLVTGQELAAIEQDVQAQIRNAIEAAKRAPFGELSTVVKTNWSNQHSALVDRFSGKVFPVFEAGQAEARLGPF